MRNIFKRKRPEPPARDQQRVDALKLTHENLILRRDCSRFKKAVAMAEMRIRLREDEIAKLTHELAVLKGEADPPTTEDTVPSPPTASELEIEDRALNLDNTEEIHLYDVQPAYFNR